MQGSLLQDGPTCSRCCDYRISQHNKSHLGTDVSHLTSSPPGRAQTGEDRLHKLTRGEAQKQKQQNSHGLQNGKESRLRERREEDESAAGGEWERSQMAQRAVFIVQHPTVYDRVITLWLSLWLLRHFDRLSTRKHLFESQLSRQQWSQSPVRGGLKSS